MLPLLRCRLPTAVCARSVHGQEIPKNEAQESIDAVGTSRKRLRTNLNERHRTLAEGGIPPAIYECEREKWELQERFGQFGISSGVDIRKLWPTVEEINEFNELKMYRKASEALRIAEQKHLEENQRLVKREAEIQQNWANYEKEFANFEENRHEVEVQKSGDDKALEKRIREIQEYFGYWIDPSDPRFGVMLKQKELEEKKAAKKAKKEAQKQKFTV